MAVTQNLPQPNPVSLSDGSVDDIWEDDLSGVSVSGSGGKLLTDNLDYPTSAIKTDTGNIEVDT